MAELEAQLKKGNHTGASRNPKKLEEKIHRDVEYGFAVPILASAAQKIKGAMLQPCNLADQFSLTETGERVLKKRLTHDLSDSITQDDASVNSRIAMDQYPPMIYGWALMRIIAFICALRLAFPDTRILIAKYDLSDAYRRICHDALAAAQTILVVGIKAYIMLRLSFGGATLRKPKW